ncbi:hypothetical protein FOZ62_018610, partial [Perkinsus olseni]
PPRCCYVLDNRTAVPSRHCLNTLTASPSQHCLSLRDAVKGLLVRLRFHEYLSGMAELWLIDEVRDTILSALRSGAEKQYFLVAGLAGTGKTYLVKEILVELKKSMTPIVLCWAG